MGSKRIINKLTSDGALFRCQGILECLQSGDKDPHIIDALKNLIGDSVVIMGRKISSYAAAALDILDVETYNGTDEEVIDLIPDLKAYVK